MPKDNIATSPSVSYEPLTERKKNPVVLVHGIWNTAAIFNPLRAHLEKAGWSVYALSMVPNNGDAPIEVLAEQVAAFIARALPVHQPFDLVGFSMGGLISRYYIQRLGGLSQVEKFITVSAPHHGTLLALGSYRPGVRQMRPGSPFIASLNRDKQRLEKLQLFSFWTPFDLLILPAWSSQLGIGTCQRLDIPTHNRMIQDPNGLRAISQALSSSR
ncbi:MAG: alpha/beta fold hydrolase [Cyanobacteria bacterium J06614_10]